MQIQKIYPLLNLYLPLNIVSIMPCAQMFWAHVARFHKTVLHIASRVVTRC